MNVALDPDTERYIQEQVKAGKYASAAELLSIAVTQLRESELAGQWDLADLERLLAEGETDFANGRFVTVAEARDRFATRAASDDPRENDIA